MNIAIAFEMPKSFANLNHPPKVDPIKHFHDVNAKVSKSKPKEFEVGKTYYTRSICDHDTIHKITVLRRSEKSIWIKDHRGERRLGVARNYDDFESVKPFGTYSMCAVISAERVWEE